jgi:hypothetical protein
MRPGHSGIFHASGRPATLASYHRRAQRLYPANKHDTTNDISHTHDGPLIRRGEAVIPSALTTIQKDAKISVLKAIAVRSLTLRPFARLDDCCCAPVRYRWRLRGGRGLRGVLCAGASRPVMRVPYLLDRGYARSRGPVLSHRIQPRGH